MDKEYVFATVPAVWHSKRNSSLLPLVVVLVLIISSLQETCLALHVCIYPRPAAKNWKNEAGWQHSD